MSEPEQPQAKEGFFKIIWNKIDNAIQEKAEKQASSGCGCNCNCESEQPEETPSKKDNCC